MLFVVEITVIKNRKTETKVETCIKKPDENLAKALLIENNASAVLLSVIGVIECLPERENYIVLADEIDKNKDYGRFY